jgi:hypothetical protein
VGRVKITKTGTLQFSECRFGSAMHPCAPRRAAQGARRPVGVTLRCIAAPAPEKRAGGDFSAFRFSTIRANHDFGGSRPESDGCPIQKTKTHA